MKCLLALLALLFAAALWLEFEAPSWAPAELAEALEAPEEPGPEQAGSLLIVFKEIKVTHL